MEVSPAPALRPYCAGTLARLRAATQVIVGAAGQLYGWEMLARRSGAPASEGAGPMLAQLRTAHDWLSLDLFMLSEAPALALAAPGAHVLVNLSPTVMYDAQSRERFLDACSVSAAAIGRYRLGIEVHEDVNWGVSELNHFIDELHARGCLAVLDDFRGMCTCWKKSCARWDVIKLDCATMPIAQALAALDVLKDGLGTPKPPMLIVEAVESVPVCDSLFDAGAHAVQGRVAGPVTLPGEGA